VIVGAGTLVLTDGGLISSSTYSAGASRRVAVNAGSLTLDSDANILHQQSRSGQRR
jgi:hypothetical protein